MLMTIIRGSDFVERVPTFVWAGFIDPIGTVVWIRAGPPCANNATVYCTYDSYPRYKGL